MTLLDTSKLQHVTNKGFQNTKSQVNGLVKKGQAGLNAGVTAGKKGFNKMAGAVKKEATAEAKKALANVKKDAKMIGRNLRAEGKAQLRSGVKKLKKIKI